MCEKDRNTQPKQEVSARCAVSYPPPGNAAGAQIEGLASQRCSQPPNRPQAHRPSSVCGFVGSQPASKRGPDAPVLSNIAPLRLGGFSFFSPHLFCIILSSVAAVTPTCRLISAVAAQRGVRLPLMASHAVNSPCISPLHLPGGSQLSPSAPRPPPPRPAAP